MPRAGGPGSYGPHTVEAFVVFSSLRPRLRLAAVRTSDKRNSTLPRELCNGSTGTDLSSTWSGTGSYAAALQGQRAPGRDRIPSKACTLDAKTHSRIS